MFFLPEYGILCKAVQNLPKLLLWKIKFIIHKAVPVVPGKSKEYAGLTVFCFAQTTAVLAPHSGGMFPFFYKTRIIHGQYTRDLPDLSGKQSMVNIHEWLFLKKGAGKELLHGADILLPRKNGVQSVQWVYVPAGLTAPV